MQLVKEGAQEHGGKLTWSIGAMMSGRVWLLGHSWSFALVAMFVTIVGITYGDAC